VRTAAHTGALARRLVLAIVAMLLPLVAAGVLGVVTFRATAGALKEFRTETVDESTRILGVRDLLVPADDAGEAYVETDDPAQAEQFAALSRRIDRGFTDLATLSTPEERELAAAAMGRWEAAFASVGKAASAPHADRDSLLDPFHDRLDEAGSLLADLDTLNVQQVADEISSLRARERFQLFASLGTLLVGAVVGGLLSRRFYRSVATPLLQLEKAATRFGSDDLAHRIAVAGNDELASVSRAFNLMAGRLQESQDGLQHQALHDPLTGLPNRALFMEQMEIALARARRRATPVSVLYLDLDGFKEVNDAVGHQAGDEILVAVSNHLRKVLRAEDTPARLGGDEFGILLEEQDVRGAVHTAHRISRAFDEPWSISSGKVSIGISIGIATRHGDEALDLLLHQADAAMYAAKAGGKDRWRVFSPDLDAGVLETRTLQAELQRAVEREEFLVHYQPIVNLQTEAIEGVEALVRWNHPDRGILPPSAFLKEAEASGHILYIDRWVLEQACRQVRRWQADVPGAENLSVHVNLSAKQLQRPGLSEQVAEALGFSGLAPEKLMLEITETTLVRDAETAAAELARLKELNVELALDDFGTGFSSLSHLVRFPIDCIKIDRSFVSSTGSDVRRSQLVLALVNLGKTLHLQVVAEGIEEIGQLDHLRSIGCEQGQGYYFSKPVASRGMEELLRAGLGERSAGTSGDVVSGVESRPAAAHLNKKRLRSPRPALLDGKRAHLGAPAPTRLTG
jgi:diguanylate cyclase (GGDEF)-like protein